MLKSINWLDLAAETPLRPARADLTAGGKRPGGGRRRSRAILLEYSPKAELDVMRVELALEGAERTLDGDTTTEATPP